MRKSLASLATVTLILAVVAGVAEARTYTLEPVGHRHGMLVFDLAKLPRTAVRSAHLRSGRSRRALPIRRVQSAVGRRHLRVAGPRRAWGSRARRAREAGRKARHRLIVRTAEPPSDTTTDPGPTGTDPESPAGSGDTSGAPLLADTFSSANGRNSLITNEWAFWNPRDELAVQSPVWNLSSGSLFSADGRGWSGRVDGTAPDRYSESSTGSYVFRLHTKRADFRSVRVEFSARVLSFWQGTDERPGVAWDGLALWPRYVDDTEVYRIYFLRRDGRIAISKKCHGQVPGGGYYAGGTYFSLYPETTYAPTQLGHWYRLAGEVRDNPDGSVTVTAFRDGVKVAEATDTGRGCAPIHGPAKSGIRADNTEFELDDYAVTALQ